MNKPVRGYHSNDSKVDRYRAGVIPKYAKVSESSNNPERNSKEIEPIQYIDSQLSRLERSNIPVTTRSGRRKFIAQVVHDFVPEQPSQVIETKSEPQVSNIITQPDIQSREQKREQALRHLEHQKKVIPFHTIQLSKHLCNSETLEPEQINHDQDDFKPRFIKKEPKITLPEIDKQPSSYPISDVSVIEEPTTSIIDDRDIPEESEQEYQAWKIRELLRLTRDIEEIDTNHQEYEILHESKTKYKFLQKYYHKGAFFMDTQDAIYQRDYDAPTSEDTIVDKTILPQIMQVKNFGKMGRSKWTHLTAEDTTSFEGPWAKSNDAYERIKDMQGGFKDINDHKKHRKS